MSNPSSDEEPDYAASVERWTPIVVRLGSFFTGTAILFWQTVLENADRPYLIGGAITLMGYPAAGILADKLGRR